ncbi:MAG TPA: ribonuclease H-like domain-containing protein [Verrucomicrobiae bacterium]|nr:ribonuclease H-like domain-containing protein [Verrucomicrobiae bacterium]
MKTLIFDIETGPLDDLETSGMMTPFDPAGVKCGNLKDPEKIAAKLAEAEAAHRHEFVERAALDPLTGRVLAIGLMTQEAQFSVIADEDEARLLQDFWRSCRGDKGRLNRMVGFNSRSFDLPFLIRRSFKHRVDIPFGVRRGRYWSDEMIDLREEWQLGDRQARGSLDAIARHLGVGKKNGHGEDFSRLWREDRLKAVDYLRTDLELTLGVAQALRVVEPAAPALRNARIDTHASPHSARLAHAELRQEWPGHPVA